MADKKIYPANGLEINFLGLPLVVNDGTTENTLLISLTNNNFFLAPDETATTIAFGPETPIYLWFVVDEGQASAEAVRHWALTSNDALHDERVSLSISPQGGDWAIERSENLSGNPLNDSLKGWKLTPTKALPLLPGQSLLVTLRGLTTDQPDGPASCYCQVDMTHLNAYGKVAKTMLKVIGPLVKSGLSVAGRTGEGGAARPTITANANVEVQGNLTTQANLDVAGDLGVAGDLSVTGGDVNIESANAGQMGPRLRLTNTGGGQGATPAIDFSPYDTRREWYGDIPAVRIHCQDDANYSGHLIISTKGPGPAQPLRERLSLSSSGDLKVEGDISGKGQVRDKNGLVVPVGTVVAFAGRQIPAGWLECRGQRCYLHTGDYAALQQVLGAETFNAWNGTYFIVPDLAGRFIVGAGSGDGLRSYTLNDRGGVESVTLTVEQMPSHTHSIDGHLYFHSRSFAGSDNGSPPLKRNHEGDNDIRLDGTDPKGGGQAHENRPPFHALTYIIKY